MRILRVFRNRTPPIFFIPSVFIAYGCLELYDRPHLIYPLFVYSARICGYSQVFVGIEDDIILNTRKFPHPIKIDGILSLDDDIQGGPEVSRHFSILNNFRQEHARELGVSLIEKGCFAA
jgi:hypothetical protein